MAEAFEYTEEYLENKRRSSGKNRYKSTKFGMKKLIDHIFEQEYLHPEQIKYITVQALKDILWFEEEALKEYENLPEKTKDFIEDNYNYCLKFKSTPESVRGTPENIVQQFYRRQREIYSETKDKVEETIKGTTEL